MSCLERRLVRELARSTELSTLSVRCEVIARRAWASALFVGTRYTVTCVVDNDGDALDQWLAALPDAEFRLSGHFVASAEVVERGAGRATIELLVIEES